MLSFAARPIAGSGIGLRAPHIAQIIEAKPEVPWFEVLTDNYLASGGIDLFSLEKVREHYPITMHSVGLSLGATAELDLPYLQRLKELRDRFKPKWLSEHLCWTSLGSHHLHDLLPLPYTEEAVHHVAARIKQVQDYFGEQILIENVSSYVSYSDSMMPEWDFVRHVAEESNCLLLLDVNNIYISSKNNGYAPLEFLEGIPRERVYEVHLAGFDEHEGVLIDTHNREVAAEVWLLYEQVLSACGPVPTLIEWDNDIPALEVLIAQAKRAENVQANVAKNAS